MTDDLFSYSEGQRLAIEGAERAHEASDAAFKAHAEATILEVARMHPTFTSDDVIRWCMVRNLPLPEKGVAWGAAFSALSKAGRIVGTGEFRKCERTTRHNGLVRVWRLA